MATAMGALGIKVDNPHHLEDLFNRALEYEGPVVIDVRTDLYEPPPFGNRIKTLDHFFAEKEK